MGELEARIRVVVRTRVVEPAEGESEIRCGDLEIDLIHHDVKYKGADIALTARSSRYCHSSRATRGAPAPIR